MNYKREKEYLVLLIDETFDNKTIEEIFQFYHISKKEIHRLRMSRNVWVNQEEINQDFNYHLKTNDHLKFPVFFDEEIDFIAQNIPIDKMYEDDFILIINKPPFIEVHPDNKKGLNTLVNAVANYYQQTNQHHRIRYIHRLDRDTSGAIIFVKNYFVHNLYDFLLSKKEIKRHYLALTVQTPHPEKGYITKAIGSDRHHNQRRIISKTGLLAKTYYEVIEKYPKYTFIRLELFTGRTHQIRVHLASINCPILGDTLYGEESPLINRQALHAYEVWILHPVTLFPFKIEIPLPKDMKKLLRTN